MALIDKSGITTGGTIQASHITDLYDALTGAGSYSIKASGSFTGSLAGTASFATTSATALTTTSASYAATASRYAGKSSFTGTYTGVTSQTNAWTYTLDYDTSGAFLWSTYTSAVMVTATVSWMKYDANAGDPPGPIIDSTNTDVALITYTGIAHMASAGIVITQQSSSLTNATLSTAICGLRTTSGAGIAFFINGGTGNPDNKIHVSLQYTPLTTELDENGLINPPLY